jgi:hypothetical protein
MMTATMATGTTDTERSSALSPPQHVSPAL